VLTPQERWDVLAFVYSLSLDETEWQNGAGLHSQHKGEIDQLLGGDELAAEFDLVAQLGLSDEETMSLTAYLHGRALGIDSGIDLDSQLIESSVEDAEDLPAFTTFSGQVLYGNGDNLPGGLEVTLFGYDHTEQVLAETASLDQDGSFSFTNIPVAPERIFFVQIPYQGQIYFSEFIGAAGEQTEFDLPIKIYETTSKPDQLAMESMQLFYDFSKPGLVRVAQQVSISNLGDRVVVPKDDILPVLHFSLPLGASALAFQDGELGERYVPEDGGFGDLRGVLPGENSYQLLFAYELPYRGGVSYPVRIDLPTRELAAYLPAGGVELQSAAFRFIGDQVVDGVTYSAFLADDGYFPGDEVQVNLRGAHPLGELGVGSVLRSLLLDESLVAGLAAVTLSVGLVWLWVRNLPLQNPQQVMDEIIALDERYEQGRVGESTYTERRSVLKSQLRNLLNKRGQA
jgi:hypothetical protein